MINSVKTRGKGAPISKKITNPSGPGGSTAVGLNTTVDIRRKAVFTVTVNSICKTCLLHHFYN